MNPLGPPHQDFVRLAGLRSPGKAEVRGLKLERKWSVPDGWGFSGASAWFIGQQLAQFDVVFSLWHSAQWPQWHAFVDQVFREPTQGLPTALSMSIQHPIVNMPPFRVVQVVMMACTGWEQDEYGLWTCSTTFLQYRAPKPALLKPYEGPPSVGEAAGPPPDPELDTIAKNNSEIERIAGS